MRNILAALALLSFSQAHAQDISAQIAEIAGRDLVKAALAAEAALSSPSATTRSLALEATLKSTDGRVRSIGYTYLIDKHKQIVFNVELPQGFGKTASGNSFEQVMRDNTTLTLAVDEYRSNNATFDGILRPMGRPFAGAIARDGITITTEFSNMGCVVRMNGVEEEYLTGSMKCGTLIFKIKSALP